MDENPQQNDPAKDLPEGDVPRKMESHEATPAATPNESAPTTENATADAPVPVPAGKKKLPKKSSFVDFVICLVTAVAIAMLLRAFIFQPFKIPTNSMHPTLVGNYAHGDRILVNLLTYKVSEPQRWDVFVFKCPDPNVDKDKTDYIKRLVGLPGDILNIKNGDIYVNKKIARKPLNVQNGIWLKEYESVFEKPYVEGSYKYWDFDNAKKWKFKNGAVEASSAKERTEIFYKRTINSENDLFPESNITTSAPLVYLRITKSTKINCPFCSYAFAPGEWEIKRPELKNYAKSTFSPEEKVLSDDFYLQCQSHNCGKLIRLEIQHTPPVKLLVYGDNSQKPNVVENFGEVAGLDDEPNYGGSSALVKSERAIIGDIKTTLDFKFLDKDTIAFLQLKSNATRYTLYLTPDYPLSDVQHNYLLASDGASTQKHKLNSETKLKTGQTITADLQNYDHSVNVLIDGELVLQFAYKDDFELSGPKYNDNGVSFGIDNGKASFSAWRIFKDIYYFDNGCGTDSQDIDLTSQNPDVRLRNRYFAMGDNSALSSDSRAWLGVPKDNIIGKAILVLWPPKHVKMIR